MNNGGMEIERRFILKGKPAETPHEVHTIFQKYSADGWRYRAQSTDGVLRYFKTRKTTIANGVNEEEEYEITQDVFDNKCGAVRKGIAKTRMVFNHDGLRFEVDEFHHINLVILEVELESIDQQFSFPAIIQPLIIYEITGIKEFSNSSLASPFYLNHF